MAKTLTVKHNRHEVEIVDPGGPNPGGVIVVRCPKDGETFAVENPHGDTNEQEEA